MSAGRKDLAVIRGSGVCRWAGSVSKYLTFSLSAEKLKFSFSPKMERQFFLKRKPAHLRTSRAATLRKCRVESARSASQRCTEQFSLQYEMLGRRVQTGRRSFEKVGVQLFDKQLDSDIFWHKVERQLNAIFFEIEHAHLPTSLAATPRTCRAASTLSAVQRCKR